MKKLILILMFLYLAGSLSAQEFKVEKVSGSVSTLRGTSEEFVSIKAGDVLLGSDLLITDENSYVQLKSSDSRFILNDNSALNLLNIKRVSPQHQTSIYQRSHSGTYNGRDKEYTCK